MDLMSLKFPELRSEPQRNLPRSLYAKYLDERDPERRILETEKGFVTYIIESQDDTKFVLIVDCYVAPEFRKTGEAKKMYEQVIEIAKNEGCTFSLGAVNPAATSAHTSLLFVLSFGHKISHVASNGLIMFKKEIL
jgi:GNAT superfamily N-acetyltransferase